MTFVYSWSDPNGDAEGATRFQWYRCDTADGTYTAIPGADSSSYTATADDIGQFLKVGVTPVDIFLGTGAEFMTPVPVSIDVNQPPTAEFVDFPLTITISGAGATEVDGVYVLDRTLGPHADGPVYNFNDRFYICSPDVFADFWFLSLPHENGTMLHVDAPAATDYSGLYYYGQELITQESASWWEAFNITTVPSVGEFGKGVSPAPTAVCEYGQYFGHVAVGSHMYFGYTFIDAEDDAEGASVIQWYYADSADGTYKPIAGANERDYYPSAALLGYYLKAGITPVDEYGRSGEEVISEPEGPVAAR